MTVGNVTAAGGTLADLKNALSNAPTVCMTTDVGNLVNASTGIYVNPGQHDLFWERPVSIEYINTAGTSEFQINCGARIRGGFSRSTSNPKHAFHLYFRGSLYDGNLNYKIFGAMPAPPLSARSTCGARKTIRGASGTTGRTRSCARNGAASRRATQASRGTRTGYFHVYINGLYWGIYNWEERTEASYGETYLGGSQGQLRRCQKCGQQR